MRILLIGGTGSIGSHVAAQALAAGHEVRVVTRTARSAKARPGAEVEFIAGDVNDPAVAAKAVEGVDAVVFTHGSNGSAADMERVDYGFVASILKALGGRKARIGLMTLMNVTHHDSGYNRSSQACDWKRRSEMLVRASGKPYVIVRPGWFDCNGAGEKRIQMLQGDARTGQPGIARADIARVLLAGIESEAAAGRTFELFNEPGEPQANLEEDFAALAADEPGELFAARDERNFPLSAQPTRFLADLKAIGSLASA